MKKSIARSAPKKALRTAGAGKRPKAVKPDHRALIETPAAMVRWLKGKKPGAIVAQDMFSNETCLLATFLRQHGHDFTVGGFSYGSNTGAEYKIPPWFDKTFDRLPTGVRITAKRALAALAKTEGR